MFDFREGGVLLTVSYVSLSKGDTVRIGTQGEADRRELCISKRECDFISALSVGYTLSTEEFDTLLYLDKKNKARKRALNILSYGDNSIPMLKIKLARAGVERRIAEEISEEMASLGYISHQRQLERLISNAVNVSLMGPRKFIPRLIAKGYSKSEIEKVLRELTEKGDTNLAVAQKKLIEKKLPEGAGEDEIKTLLYKNGYSV